MNYSKPIAAFFGLAASIASPLFAETLRVTTTEELRAALAAAQPGDSIRIEPGTYAVATTVEATLNGTAEMPIVIEAARDDRPLFESPSGAAALALTGSYVAVRELDFGGAGTALRVSGEAIDLLELVVNGGRGGVVFEDCTTCTLFDSEFTGTGPDPAVAATGLANGQFVNNYMHRLNGPGFDLAGGAHLILDNVIEDASGGPAISVTDTAPAGTPTLIEANFAVGAGITLVGGGAVQNNIVWNASGSGILSDVGTDGATADVLIRHNTIVGQNCFTAQNWPLSVGVTVLANNALYCPEGAAITFEDGIGVNSIITANVYLGRTDFPGDSITGRSLDEDFTAGRDGNFYPAGGSTLIGAGEPTEMTEFDFNGTRRSEPTDVGAYERIGSSNPGLIPGGGFKTPLEPLPGDGDGDGDNGDGDNGDGDGDGAGGGGENGGGGSTPRGSVGSGTGFPPTDTGCACSATGDPGSGFLVLLLGFAAALPRLRRKNSAV